MLSFLKSNNFSYKCNEVNKEKHLKCSELEVYFKTVLSKSTCVNVLSYFAPLSVTQYTDENKVDLTLPIV